MAEIFGKIDLYFQYPFVRYALIVGVLIALCSSLLGVTLVLRRFSFIGDGLSHVDVYKRQPVPIPNTEVKLLSADDTWRETARESRTLPFF